MVYVNFRQTGLNKPHWHRIKYKVPSVAEWVPFIDMCLHRLSWFALIFVSLVGMAAAARTVHISL